MRKKREWPGIKTRLKCPLRCPCSCHDTGGYDYDGEHGPNGGPCPGKVLS